MSHEFFYSLKSLKLEQYITDSEVKFPNLNNWKKLCAFKMELEWCAYLNFKAYTHSCKTTFDNPIYDLNFNPFNRKSFWLPSTFSKFCTVSNEDIHGYTTVLLNWHPHLNNIKCCPFCHAKTLDSAKHLLTNCKIILASQHSYWNNALTQLIPLRNRHNSTEINPSYFLYFIYKYIHNPSCVTSRYHFWLILMGADTFIHNTWIKFNSKGSAFRTKLCSLCITWIQTISDCVACNSLYPLCSFSSDHIQIELPSLSTIPDNCVTGDINFRCSEVGSTFEITLYSNKNTINFKHSLGPLSRVDCALWAISASIELLKKFWSTSTYCTILLPSFKAYKLIYFHSLNANTCSQLYDIRITLAKSNIKFLCNAFALTELPILSDLPISSFEYASMQDLLDSAITESDASALTLPTFIPRLGEG
jgi:hypothetical protein